MSRLKSRRRSRQSGFSAYAIAIALSALCYANSLSGDFVHDDIPAVTLNPDVLGTTTIGRMVSNDFWGMPMSDANSHKSYRPLTILTFRINSWLFGMNPFWFHFGNVILHAICSGLFTRIAFVVAGLQLRFAALAGALFASHPIHTEAVAGIVGRADVLACFFFALSFLSYHDYRWRCDKRVMLSTIFAGAGMLAKETGVTVLLVNILYDFYRSWNHIKRSVNEKSWNEDSYLFCKRITKMIIVMIILISLRLAMLQGTLPKFSNQDNPAAFHPLPSVRFLTQSYLAAFNFWLLVFPYTLSHDWQMSSIPLVTNIMDQRNLLTCLLLIFCCWTVYRIIMDLEGYFHLYPHHPSQLFNEFAVLLYLGNTSHSSIPMVIGLLFLTIPFLPASNLIFTVGFVVAERVLYIPSMGVILLVAYGSQLVSQKVAELFQRSWPVSLGLIFLVILFASRTILRNQDWKNRETLIKSGLAALPTNSKMHYNYANFLRENGYRESSLLHYKEALRLWPSYASAHNNLGTLMTSPTEAESYFLSAIQYSPSHVNAHYNLGQIYKKMNKTEEAVQMLQKCLKLNSNYIGAYLLLSKLYEGPISGRLLRHATKLQSTNHNYFAYYAQWLHKNHRYYESIHYFKKALALCPTHKTSLIGLAHVYRDAGYLCRLHQIIIRWHINCRHQDQENTRIVYTGDLYLRGWDMYKQGQGTLLRELPVVHQSNNDITCNSLELVPMLISGEETEPKHVKVSTSGAVSVVFVQRGTSS